MRGHIRKRAKDSWAVVVELPRDPETGRRRQKWVTVKGTRREAERVLADLVVRINAGTYVPAKETVQEYLERWLSDYATPSVRPLTLCQYQRIVRKHIVPALGRIPIARLSPSHVQKLYADKLREGLSPRTVRYIHAVLHAALEDAVKEGLCGRNAAHLARPPEKEAKERPVLSEEESRILLDRLADPRLRIPAALALGAGLRRGEALGLRWCDVDLDGHRLYVSQTMQHIPGEGVAARPPKTAAGRRCVAIPGFLVETLREWRRRQLEARLAAGPAWQDHGLVCTRADGCPLDPEWLTRAFRNAIRKLGLPPVHFHDLRHTHATFLLKLGAHPRVVQERLGHSEVGVTLGTYSHVLPDMQEEAARRLDRLFRAALSGEPANRTTGSR
ncbi:MAG: tyrosine-type recombinase/integrase [Bacillota bacterium]